MIAPAYTLTNESITVIHEGTLHTIQKGVVQFHVLRTAILEAIGTDDWSKVIESLTVVGSLQQYLGERWEVDGERALRLDGNPVPRSISDRIWRLANAGTSPEPVFRFYERLSRNPSRRSVQQLFDFLQHTNIPLEEDGRFLAYKAVQGDFKDVYTGKVENHPGVINKMDRNLVSDDPQEACHYGFHVGSLSYALNYHRGGQLVICRIDPEHVVCVPHDASYQKMRVCEYEVVGLYAGVPMSSDIHHEEVVDDDEWTEDEDEDEDAEDEDEEESDSEDEPWAGVGVDIDVDSDYEGEDDDGQGWNPPAAPPVSVKAPEAPEAAFHEMDAGSLMSQSIHDLRAYAVHTLKIIGASRLPGGKATLISTILKLRRRK